MADLGSIPLGASVKLAAESEGAGGNGGGVVDSVSTTDPWLNISPTTGNVVVGQRVAANWPIGSVRWYAVDAVNGIDTNVGFSDTSSADAGTKAKKTMAALAAIIPQIGDGRFIVVVVAQGTYATGLTFLNAAGYNNPTVVCTATNATAGAVAFAGDVADLSYAGAVTAPGLNAAGYNPTVAATTTSIPCTKVGGGAPGFTVDGATSALAGFRIRFDINTATVALRNKIETIQTVPGTDTVTTCVALPAAPTAADVFYIEAPGMVVPRVRQLLSAFSLNGWSVVGADFQTTSQFATGASLYATFCRFRGNLTMQGGLLVSAGGVSHPTVGGAFAGGCRFDSALSCIGTGFTMDRSYASTLLLEFCYNTQLDIGSCVGNLSVVGKSTSSNLFAKVGQNITAQGQPVRVLGTNSTGAGPIAGIYLQDAQVAFGAIAGGGQGANPGISVQGSCSIQFVGQGAVSGNTGTNVGIDLTGAQGSTIATPVTPTITGTAGDVRLAGGQIVSWAAIAATGLVDTAGNRFIGSSGPLQVVATLSGTLQVSAGGATTTDLGDPGTQPLLNSNSSSNVEYATSARLITRMRVYWPIVNGATAVNVTLAKRLKTTGVRADTTMTVNIPGAQAANTTLVDLAHPILFADGDTFAVHADSAAAPEGGGKSLTVTLEGPC